jgi:4-hydroxythreonine-4-phosphate dehydrogenase
MPSVVKRNGSRHDYEAIKLRASLSLALRKRPISTEDVDAVVMRIEDKLLTSGEREVSTEFLGELSERFYQEKAQPVMMIWSTMLSVVPLTIHIPLRQVADAMTAECLEDSVKIIDRDWRRWFSNNVAPRLVLAGINPHAGEDGHIGWEEERILKPAVKKLQERGFDLKGPFSADTLFHAQARQSYDIALCPSHDQALIPVKTLAFDDGVNITLGLPFIRTSPDHGTAFDLAGTGKARPDSMIAALKKAHAMMMAAATHAQSSR